MTNEAPKILNAPERIYLHVGSLDDALDDVPFSELSEVSWCAHRVDDADIEYVLADDAAATIRQQAERIGVLEAALRQVTDHFADVMGGPLIAGSGVTFHSGIENIPTIKAARAALTTAAPADGRERCPDCSRPKARNADDCAAGDCPKWWAVRDKEADRDCRNHAAPEGPKP